MRGSGSSEEDPPSIHSSIHQMQIQVILMIEVKVEALTLFSFHESKINGGFKNDNSASFFLPNQNSRGW